MLMAHESLWTKFSEALRLAGLPEKFSHLDRALKAYFSRAISAGCPPMTQSGHGTRVTILRYDSKLSNG
jgi:hypothetical protein